MRQAEYLFAPAARLAQKRVQQDHPVPGFHERISFAPFRGFRKLAPGHCNPGQRSKLSIKFMLQVKRASTVNVMISVDRGGSL